MGISTHVLDTALGRPAADVGLTLEVHRCGEWEELHRAQTDSDGRCRDLLPDQHELEPAVYRIRFATEEYYKARGEQGLYPVVEITFMVRSVMEHYHIPLLLTANGYTTYRGS